MDVGDPKLVRQRTVGHPTYHDNVIKLNINERLYGQVGYPT